MVVAGEIIGIRIYDHIILSRGEFYSFQVHGKIPNDIQEILPKVAGL